MVTAEFILMLNDCEPEPPTLSVAVAVKLKVPDDVGVPVIWPVPELMVMPGGAPAERDQV